MYGRDRYRTTVIKAGYYWPPVDLLMLSGFLFQRYETVVIDAIVEKMNVKSCLSRIIEGSFDAIIFLTCSASWKEDFDFIRQIKEHKENTIIIANGGYLLFKGREVMEQYSFIDAVILNISTPDIIDYLEGKEHLENIIHRKGGEIIDMERTCTSSYRIPVPRHELFPVGKYNYPFLFSDFTVVYTTLGCPYRCPPCIASSLGFQVRSIDNVLGELKYIGSLGIRKVIFGDLTFTTEKEHVRELCSGILEENLRLEWTCQTRPDQIDEGLLRTMKKAGCMAIEFGVESGEERTMQALKPGLTKEKTRRAFDLCKKHKILTQAFFIVGMPGEDDESIQDTIRFARELDPDTATFNFPMPHQGTELGTSWGIDEEPFGEHHFYNNVTPASIKFSGSSWDKAMVLRKKAYRSFYMRPGYILKKLKQVSSLNELWVYLKMFSSLLSETRREGFEKRDV